MNVEEMNKRYKRGFMNHDDIGQSPTIDFQYAIPFLKKDVPELFNELDRLTARNAELVEVVKELLGSIEEYQIGLAVATNSSGIKQCPGCEVTARYDRKFPHKSGCILERAAALVEEVKE